MVPWGGLIGVFFAVQFAIAQINEQIGAAGVVNHECKQVVAGYGLEMLELLKTLVRANYYVLETFVFLTSSFLPRC